MFHRQRGSGTTKLAAWEHGQAIDLWGNAWVRKNKHKKYKHHKHKKYKHHLPGFVLQDAKVVEVLRTDPEHTSLEQPVSELPHTDAATPDKTVALATELQTSGVEHTFNPNGCLKLPALPKFDKITADSDVQKWLGRVQGMLEIGMPDRSKWVLLAPCCP